MYYQRAAVEDVHAYPLMRDVTRQKSIAKKPIAHHAAKHCRFRNHKSERSLADQSPALGSVIGHSV
jgi:hypothetical protein